MYLNIFKNGGGNMKIVLPDAQTVYNNDLSLDGLKELGEVVEYKLTSPDELLERIKDADAVICNKTVLSGELLKKTKVKYIGLFATGYNNIDIEYCKENSITVCNAGSYSTDAVAQHTFALILEIYNKVGKYNDFVAQGNWKKSKTFSPFCFSLSELSGKTIGIIGCGSIGKKVAQIAKAFGMNVLAYNRTKRDDDICKYVSLDELLKNSDIVSVHCPLNNESENLINAENIAKMRDGAVFINTARGAVMDENAVLEALKSGKLSYAGIDVLSQEPMAQDCVLFDAPNCIITPHIAWAPIETRQRLMEIVVDNLSSYLNGNPKNKIC